MSLTSWSDEKTDKFWLSIQQNKECFSILSDDGIEPLLGINFINNQLYFFTEGENNESVHLFYSKHFRKISDFKRDEILKNTPLICEISNADSTSTSKKTIVNSSSTYQLQCEESAVFENGVIDFDYLYSITKSSAKPDNVAFDEDSETYTASILPYGTNIGAPSILADDISTWKNVSINHFNHSFHNKIEEIKDKYEKLVDEFRTNEMVYNAKLNFEPVIGKTYHLYINEQDEPFLSLIPPQSWKKEYLGSFKLNHEKAWVKESLED